MEVSLMKECIICHKMFEPSHFNQKRCPGPHYKQCPVCGKNMPWTEYDRCCSKECTDIKRKATNLEKYGFEYSQQSEVVQAKSRATCLKNHGVEYPAQNKDIRDKQMQAYDAHFGRSTNPEGWKAMDDRRKATCLEKYGTEYSFQSDNNKIKSKQTCLEKYGTEFAMQCPDIKNRMTQIIFHKYGVCNAMQAPEVQAKLRKSVRAKYGVEHTFQSPLVRNQIVATNLAKYGVPWYCMTPECKSASGKIISKLNQSFAAFLDVNDVKYEMEFRLENCSFDFKIGNTLIEIDPAFTHNCAFNPFDKTCPGLPKDYHLNKTKLANKYDYRCIHVFDWDSWEIILSLLDTQKQVYYARNCALREVPQSDCDTFLAVNHLQNTCKGQSVRLGLYSDSGTLIELVALGNPRYNKKYEWELLRLCTDTHSAVVGGSAKLMHHFIDKYQPQSIISYSDISKFTGKVYDDLGFKLIGNSEPAKIWYKDGKHITDNLLRQRGYDQLFNANYGKGTSNEQLMLDHYWWPIYDCGQHIFEWRKSCQTT